MSEQTAENTNTAKGKWILRLIFSVISFFFWLFILGTLLWHIFAPERPLPDQKRQDVGIKVINQVSEEIRNGRGSTRRVVMLHFANDNTSFISGTLRNKLMSSGIVNLEDTSAKEKIQKYLKLEIVGCSSQAEAMRTVKGSNADAVLWGSIEKYESFEGGVLLKGNWQLVNIKTGEVICSGTFDEDTSKKIPAKVDQTLKEIEKTVEPLKETAQVFPWYLRVLIYVAVILLLPILTFTVLRSVVTKHSNKLNAVVLSIYTVFGAILSFFMVGGCFTSIWSVLLFIGGIAFAFLYSGAMMGFALKLES